MFNATLHYNRKKNRFLIKMMAPHHLFMIFQKKKDYYKFILKIKVRNIYMEKKKLTTNTLGYT